MSITEMCAVMLAYENGAKIEERFIFTSYRQFYATDKPQWDWSNFEYRVAEFPEEQDDE